VALFCLTFIQHQETQAGVCVEGKKCRTKTLVLEGELALIISGCMKDFKKEGMENPKKGER
jgi:hypothetical protein